ncbi:hypothetical protein OY671_010158, partial [Metschnikowia pulcherrima]
EGGNLGNAMMALATYVGHVNIGETYWYMQAVPELMAIAGKRFEAFGSTHSRKHRAVSPSTVAAYRDTFRSSLAFAEASIGKAPTRSTLSDLDAEMILGFSDHLERERGNAVRSRNARSAAIRSFSKYA